MVMEKERRLKEKRSTEEQQPTSKPMATKKNSRALHLSADSSARAGCVDAPGAVDDSDKTLAEGNPPAAPERRAASREKERADPSSY